MAVTILAGSLDRLIAVFVCAFALLLHARIRHISEAPPAGRNGRIRIKALAFHFTMQPNRARVRLRGAEAVDPLRRRRTDKGTNVAEAAFLGSAARAVVPTASVRED